MNAITARHLATLRAGRAIDRAFISGVQAQEAMRIYAEESGTASTGTAAPNAARDLYRRKFEVEKELAQHFKQQNPNSHYVTRTECAQVVALALDEYHGEAMTALEAGVSVFGAEHGAACMKRNITAKALRSGLADNMQHAGYQALVRLNGRREITKQAAGGTMSGLYNSLVNGSRVVKRMEALEQAQAEQAGELEALKARLAALEARNDITDSGASLKATVLALYKSGKGYKAVSNETGVSVSTVRNWVKAASL